MFLYQRLTKNQRYEKTAAALAVCAATVLLVHCPQAVADRRVIGLNGTWNIAESLSADDMPGRFPHTVAVPGLVSQAQPPFADVNQYATVEMMSRHPNLFDPEVEGAVKGMGRTRQKRDYFWYKRTFKVSTRRQRAVLVVHKAKFGTAVWLNGTSVGEHVGCATAGIFDVTEAIDWAGENCLVIRIGAHPGALPDWAFGEADVSRYHWAPGIYDRVSLRLADPYEDHPYLARQFPGLAGKPPLIDMRLLEKTQGKKRKALPHAVIINEYDWIWLRRNGTPTELSRDIYCKALGPEPSPKQCRELAAYMLGALTEHWRAYRQHAGVLFYTYLGLDEPRVRTCDYFLDVREGVLEPSFADYMREAFKPLGVYIAFFQPTAKPGATHRYDVMLVNDTYTKARGRLELLWESEGQSVERTERPFAVAAVGQTTCKLELATPQQPGYYILKARAFWEGKPFSPTVSRRKVVVGTASDK